MFSFKINDLKFSGGESIYVGDCDVLIFVGANNCGKTRAIGEIKSLVTRSTYPCKVIDSVNTDKFDGHDPSDMIAWLDKLYSSSSEKIVTREGNITKLEIDHLYNNPGGLHYDPDPAIYKLLIRVNAAEDRLRVAQVTDAVDFLEASPTHPIHNLQYNQNLAQIVSNEVKSAFGTYLITPMKLIGKLKFYISDEPIPFRHDDYQTSEYREWLGTLRDLEHDGHGIRAFVSCLLSSVIDDSKILFVDEPELFLHPPQARRIAQLLASNASSNYQQVVLATHSPEIIQGSMIGTNRVAIIRINRHKDTNHAYKLGSDEIANLWRNPLLKSAKAINGLFHEGVIVCEGESDVRFYEGLLRHLEDSDKLGKPVDFYFVSGGGVGTIKLLVSAYIALNIPVIAIVDYDIILKRDEFRSTIEMMGGDYTDIQDLHNKVLNDLQKLGTDMEEAGADNEDAENDLEQAQAILNSIRPEEKISQYEFDEITKLLRKVVVKNDPIKVNGINVLTESAEIVDCQQLIDMVAELGLYVVPVGELESWNRAIAGRNNKNRWLQIALERIYDGSNSFSEAEEFIERIANHLFQHTSI